MVKNLGTIDRALRIFLTILFAVLIIIGVFHKAGTITIFSVFGAYFLITAILEHCFIYALLGLHTLRFKSGVDD